MIIDVILPLTLNIIGLGFIIYLLIDREKQWRVMKLDELKNLRIGL